MEEVLLIQEEIEGVNTCYERKFNRLNIWAHEQAVATNSMEPCSLLSFTLTKVNKLTVFTHHLQRPHMFMTEKQEFWKMLMIYKGISSKS